MESSLSDIAQTLNQSGKKVQLIYAFNGIGKTRLSREFKNLVSPKDYESNESQDFSISNILYYNAFTEDLFFWDNDLEQDAKPRLRIQQNTFTDWVLKDQGQDRNIITNFQLYTNVKLTPYFDEEFSEVTFRYESGDDEHSDSLKISKGEESIFVWSVFYTLLEQIIAVSNDIDLDFDEESEREFANLQYVFIDDPVSSLDEGHLINLAVNLAILIKKSPSKLKFIITTHSYLFYNVLHNELNRDEKKLGYKGSLSGFCLNRLENGQLELDGQSNDRPFAYHIFLLEELKVAIETGQLQKYHFNFLRNILEKTATFLGYKHWGDLLPRSNDGTSEAYVSRITNLYSHSRHSGDEVQYLEEDDKRVLNFLVNDLIKTCRFKQEVIDD